MVSVIVMSLLKARLTGEFISFVCCVAPPLFFGTRLVDEAAHLGAKLNLVLQSTGWAEQAGEALN